jgi:phospholipid/cholesterol/gamma-HCH transport system substrate-binding protein
MARNTANNLKLGIFVTIGTLCLILGLYMIGRNKSLFGANFMVKTRFHNVDGLLIGNNVRFSGIQAGTVRSINLVNDTTLEVELLLDNNVKKFIHKNAITTLGTEGLMGNKVVNITPVLGDAPPVQEGDMLETIKSASPIEMMQTLSKTNDNAADISVAVKEAILRLNNSTTLWAVLSDTGLSNDVKTSLQNIRKASKTATESIADLRAIVQDVKSGKGTMGELLNDKEMAGNLKDAIAHVQRASKEADGLVVRLDSLVADVQHDLNRGPGTMHDLLKDPEMAKKLSNSLTNIEKGTALFNEDMEALKHNFLTKGYFKKQEKEKKKGK